MALFDNLLELQYDGIPLPFESLDTEGGHELAEHQRVDRNGARLEGTGRKPYRFSVRIPFINNLFRGPQETWDPVNLFPTAFLAFLSALEDRSTKTLRHPLFGELQVKAPTWKIQLVADTQGGVIVEVVFQETTEEDEAEGLGESNALGLVQGTATDLTSQLAAISPAPELGLDESFDSLEDFANQIASVGDQAELLQNKVVGKIDSVIASLDKMSAGLDKTANVIADTPGTIVSHLQPLGLAAERVIENASRMSFALTALKSSLRTDDRTIAIYTTVADTTLASLAQQLQNRIEDIVALNRPLCSQLLIPPNTAVRYYLRAAA